MGTVSSSVEPLAANLLVTGANGFLGRAIIRAAQAAGCQVRAITRRHDPALKVEQVVVDLAAEGAQQALAEALTGVTAVVHAAAASGDEAAHDRDTVAATQAIIAAILAQTAPPRLILISSMAVYGYSSLPVGVQLDETTPLEPDPLMRDPYCRAKLAQERLARRAAQIDGLSVWALRPGPIVGPGNTRTARLGIALGPILLMLGGRAKLPLITVEDCAAAVLCAAKTPPAPNDYPIVKGGGSFAAVNLIGADQPTQAAYAEQIAREGWPWRILRLPLNLARVPAQILALPGALMPGRLGLHGLLRLETFDARFKHLRYSTARYADLLDNAEIGCRPLKVLGQNESQHVEHDRSRGPLAGETKALNGCKIGRFGVPS